MPGRARLAARLRDAASSSSNIARPSIRRRKAISGRWREALLDALDAPVAVVCPVFPATGTHPLHGPSLRRRPAPQRIGHGEASAQPDDRSRHPPLAAPADARRGRPPCLCRGPPGRGRDPRRRSTPRRPRGHRLVVVDAVTDDDLVAIGTAAADHKLVTGGSGIALGLPDNFRRAGLLAGQRLGLRRRPGPGVVLSGSCSPASRGQVDRLPRRPSRPQGRSGCGHGRRPHGGGCGRLRARRRSREAPIVYSTAEPDAVEGGAGAPRPGASRRQPSSASSARSRRGSSRAASTRLAVGGGETAGAVVTALGVERFSIGPEIDPGVPALAAEGDAGCCSR